MAYTISKGLAYCIHYNLVDYDQEDQRLYSIILCI